MAPTFRPGTLEDSYLVYTIFERALDDFSRRAHVEADETAGDPAAWDRRRPLFEHLARTAEQFWIAEEAGHAIGYARAIRRDDTRELTEFFVLPGSQSAGVGRELLARAFPATGVNHRSIIATFDARALGRYLRAGVYARFPIYFFRRAPAVAPQPSDLTIEAFREAAPILPELQAIDRVVLGYTRDRDHVWLAQTHSGHLYRRQGQVMGYGYAGASNGPFALLDAGDYPAVLAHAEAQGAARGDAETGFEVPLINRHAVGYLLRRGYRMDSFFAFYMCDAPVGKLENYIVTSPPFFM
jgi:GNAT superfamily N-acetyltransferase